MLEVVEKSDRLEIKSPMPLGKRLLFALVGLFPLIAPYELLLRPRWTGVFSPFFALAAVVSLGALALSLLLLFAAIAGLEMTLTFDRRACMLAAAQRAPVVPLAVRRFPLSAIESVGVEVHEWSDGPDTFSLSVTVAGAVVARTLSVYDRREIDGLVARVEAFLGWEPQGVPS